MTSNLKRLLVIAGAGVAGLHLRVQAAVTLPSAAAALCALGRGRPLVPAAHPAGRLSRLRVQWAAPVLDRARDGRVPHNSARCQSS